MQRTTTGPNRPPEPLNIIEATPTSVRFTMGDTLPHARARYGAIRSAKARCAHREVVALAGIYLNESDVDALLAAMREAIERDEVRMETLRDRQREWAR